MKAVVHDGPAGWDGLKTKEMREASAGSGEVKVRLKASGLNHRDIWVLYRRKETDRPVILGSDGAGVVEHVGEGVEGIRVGDEVVINPSLGWSHTSDAPPAGFDILGSPTPGTFAESIVVPAENIEKKPAHLDWGEAGILPLAALTAYRALFTRGRLQAGEHVLIPGIGSGVATFILMMAKVAGARVTVTSRSEEKRNKALELGADAAIDSEGDWQKSMKDDQADLIIDSVGPATFEKALGRLKSGGRFVNFGASTGESVKLPLRPFFYGQFNLLGTTMGSAEEFRKMLRLVETHQIRPVLDQTYPLSEALQAFQRMKDGKQFGKIGLKID
ncbi:zinc-binding dehydrogenase [Paludifilum halophilum]|uniref:Alcohol dehydrogenase n=1 Tax=Paludifilum halophilum TaxID=1642702 RepID=A0A235BCC0_9BACL|nr:zinc-binding dehydrogenase [Paludifilum halophilum]OYD09587.1 alcohol dehydrogenase [Paludifilum halophilum]